MNEDTRIIRALKEGNVEVFDEIFLKYYPGLLIFAKNRLPYPSDEAEDIVSEVFCTLWKCISGLIINTSLASYLYMAVKNKIYDYLKKNKLLLTDMNEQLQNYTMDRYLEPDQLLLYKELDHRVQYLIGRLPDRMRIVFQMSRNDGLTYEEIAFILDISVNSVKTHMFRALKFLKSAYHSNNSH
jgi:RNA polymerase sigma-70 factor (family 1)